LNKFDTRDAARKPEQGIRVTAAPVDCDAREFIIHLFTELCTRAAAEAPRRAASPGGRRATSKTSAFSAPTFAQMETRGGAEYKGVELLYRQ
jgi:hypothetical protein